MTQEKIRTNQLALDGTSLILPAGVLLPYGGNSAPTGFLLCNGATVSRTTYALLFAAISTTYNTGGEAGTDFRLPNMQGKVAVGKNTSGAFAVQSAALIGVEDVTLTIAEMPSHSHSLSGGSTNNTGAHTHALTGSVGLGGGHSHTRTFSTYGNNGGGGSTSYVPTSSGGGVTVNTSYASAHNHPIFGSTDNIGNHTHTLSGSTALTGTGNSHTNIQPSLVTQYLITTGE